jgi:hypothetical protein
MMLRPSTSRQYGGRTTVRVAAFEVPAVAACRAVACGEVADAQAPRVAVALPANRPVGELSDQVGVPVVGAYSSIM